MDRWWAIMARRVTRESCGACANNTDGSPIPGTRRDDVFIETRDEMSLPVFHNTLVDSAGGVGIGEGRGRGLLGRRSRGVFGWGGARGVGSRSPSRKRKFTSSKSRHFVGSKGRGLPHPGPITKDSSSPPKHNAKVLVSICMRVECLLTTRSINQ